MEAVILDLAPGRATSHVCAVRQCLFIEDYCYDLCRAQTLTLQYSGDTDFLPSTSGQSGSPAGPTILVVSR